MKISFLEHFDLSDFHQTFLSAFSDYLIPMNLSRDQFRELLKRRGARSEISVAAFENDFPVGFTMNAFESYQGFPTVYDVVTGVVPEARKKGIGRQMFDFSLPRIKTLGATRYVLEVFENNERAVRLYEKIGFSMVRKLEVFTRSAAGGSQTAPYEVKEIKPEWQLFQAFWDWHPSWQNSVLSLQRIHDRKLILGIFTQSEIIGYGVIIPETGDIPQFAVHHNHRRKSAGTMLFDQLQARMQRGKTVRVVNVDGTAQGTILFLENIGFTLLGRQNEMMLQL